MRLYHVTLKDKDYQKVLLPRVPEKTMLGEDIKTERICLAPSIKQCISGLGGTNCFDEDNRIRVYSVEIDENDANLVDWKTLYEKGYVNDTPITHEYWYKKPLMPDYYSVYEVRDVVLRYYYIVSVDQKERIIKIIEDGGIKVADEIRNMCALELLDSYRDSESFERILSQLVHHVKCYEDNMRETVQNLWGELEQFEPIKDYDQVTHKNHSFS